MNDNINNKISGNMHEYSLSINAEISGEGPTLNALMSNADAFHALGGSPLMLTEHVENGIDAIKVRANWKETDNEKHVGKIDIIIDDQSERVIVIDNGSGIEDPLWILRHPLHSKKIGQEYQVGKYGRGLQGFRGFCENLEYISVRKSPHSSEQEFYQKALSEKKIQGFNSCVKLKFVNNTVRCEYVLVDKAEFRRYTNNDTGTVAIFSKWHDGEFEELKRRKGELFNRLQHHFRNVLENELISISIISDHTVNNIPARDFSDLDKYDIEDCEVKNPYTHEHVGIVRFFLYKSSGAYKHEFKKPFLLTRDHRPLQNSFISEMPQFKGDPIWRSPFVTGFITCDFVEPNQLRIALSMDRDLAIKNRYLSNVIRAAGHELKRLVAEFQAGFLKLERRAQNQNITLEIQSFLKKQKIKLELPNLAKSGTLQNANSGNKAIGNRISTVTGTKNRGRIISEGTNEVVILYDPDEHNMTDLPKDKKVKKRIPVNIRFPNKDGRTEKTVLIDPKLLSKDGRRTKQHLTGIGLDIVQEELNTDMSYYDPNTMTVYVNELHTIFQNMSKLKNASSENSVYSKKQKNYIRRCYMWELIKNFHKADEGEDKYEKFWELYHTFFLYKDDQ